MDEFKAHKTGPVVSALKEKGIQSILVPAGFTSELQPLDVSINKPIKAILRQQWQNWFDSPEPIFTKAGNRQKPSYQALVDMTAKVYDGIISNVDMIKKVFNFLKYKIKYLFMYFVIIRHFRVRVSCSKMILP